MGSHGAAQVDVTNDAEMTVVYNLLRDHYVTDDDGMFRFDYSIPLLRWFVIFPPSFFFPVSPFCVLFSCFFSFSFPVCFVSSPVLFRSLSPLPGPFVLLGGRRFGILEFGE